MYCNWSESENDIREDLFSKITIHHDRFGFSEKKRLRVKCKFIHYDRDFRQFTITLTFLIYR